MRDRHPTPVSLAVFSRYQRLSVMLLIAVCAGLSGCAAPPGQATQSDRVFNQDGSEQWVQFGVLLWVQRIELAADDGTLEPAMRMELVLDDGRSVEVEQPLSQAGGLGPGDRVRLLQIGDYSQVTFWPYQLGRQDKPAKATQKKSP